ncbi:MAG: hypothetical protein J5I53_02790 [Bradyrhizobiaceae bacterium]|nr:hypothetical protein [Bradyrhizobiaceae bacterium]
MATELSHVQDVLQLEFRRVQDALFDYQRTWFTERSREFFSLELCGEAGELANLEKKRWKGTEIENGRFGEEAADVFIALLNYCERAKIDLAQAIAEKIAKIPPSKHP